MNLAINNQTMSSREIADLTGKDHRNVLADCDKLNESYKKLGLAEISAGVYLHPNTGNQKHREYLLTRIQTFDLMTGYNTELRIKVNRRWEELEKKGIIDFSNPDVVLQLAQNFKEEHDKRIEAEKQVLIKSEQLKLQEHVIQESAPKVEYYENVLQSESLISTNVIAKDLGMSAPSLNRLLNKLGIIYKSGHTWVLYHRFQSFGYTRSRTYDYMDRNGAKQTAIHMYWTEKGREFIIKQVKYFKEKYYRAISGV